MPKIQCTSEPSESSNTIFCQFISVSEQEKGEFQVKPF